MSLSRALVLLTAILLPPSTSSAQSAELRGTVRDSANRPIGDVEVSVRGVPTRVTTDMVGRFLFRGLPGDSAHLSLRRVGYRPLTLAVTLVGEGLPALSLVLVPEQHLLPELITTARVTKPAKYAATVKYDDFFRRQKLGLGTFISREQIEKMNAYRDAKVQGHRRARDCPGVH